MNELLSFIADREGKLSQPFNRFTDTSALDAVDLTFRYVFRVALQRRLSRVGREVVKSAFLVTNSAVAHYVKIHAILTDHSPLKVAMFRDYGAAAEWLGVPVKLLRMPRPPPRGRDLGLA